MPLVPPAGQPDDSGFSDFLLSKFELDPVSTSLLGGSIAEIHGIGEVIVGKGTGADLLLSIEQGSTLNFTVFDKHLRLLRGDFLTGWTWGKNAANRDEATWVKDGRVIVGKLGTHVFQLVNLVKQGRQLQLLWEDVVSLKLKGKKGVKKAYRGTTGEDVTRAEFIGQLCDEAGVELYCPELHKPQPIKKKSQKVSAKDRKAGAGAGLDPHAKLTIKGVAIDADQRSNLERSLDVAASTHGAGEIPTKAMIVAGITESLYRRSAVNGTHHGIWQSDQIPGDDLEKQAAHFLEGGMSFRAGGAIKAVKDHPSWNLGQIAAYVEISGVGSPPANSADYERWAGEAEKIYAAYRGAKSDGVTVNVETRVVFERGVDETSWDCAIRLAGEVGWAFFPRSGRAWLISEDDLSNQKPQLVARLTLPGEPGHHDNPVDDIDFEIDLDARDPVSEIDAITFHGDAWTALPGMSITVEGTGPADGKWLLNEVSVPLLSRVQARVAKARKPIRELPEPAADTESKTVGAGASASVAGDIASLVQGGVPEKIATAYGAAKTMDRAGFPYRWGGGHNNRFAPSAGSPPGYDCSGSISSVLHTAGLLGAPLTSGLFESWGKPGKGKFLTIYANGTHVFSIFTLPGHKAEHFGTGRWGTDKNGPGFKPNLHPISGFVARHPEGG